MQLGCVPVITGAVGEAGAALIKTVEEGFEVPQPFVAVTVYDPGVTLEKTPIVLVASIVAPLIRL